MDKRILKRIKNTCLQIMKSRFVLLIFVFGILSSVLIGRLFYLQIVKGDYYSENYMLQIRKVRSIPGTRGNIYDRNGELLAYNELAYSVTFEDTIPSGENRNETMNHILTEVIHIVESHGDSVISNFGIVLDSAGNYQYSQTNETLRLRFIADVYGESYVDDLDEEKRNSTAEELIHYLCSHPAYGYDIDEKTISKEEVLKLVTMRYAIGLNSYQQYIPTVLASDVSDETAAAIMENLYRLQGIDIEEESLRRYADSECFASIIGYTGKISQEEYDALDKEQKKRYSLSDIVGKSGLEQELDSVLQGDKGEIVFYTNSLGKVTETVSHKTQGVGNDVYLTIDKNLQKQTYHLLEEKIAGIVLSKLRNVLTYDASTASDAKEIIIPVGDAYHAFIANEIIDERHFGNEDAGQAEREIYTVFTGRREEVLREIENELSTGTAYNALSEEMQAYMDYVSVTLLQQKTGILMSEDIDTSDEIYQAWTTKETISLKEYLNYAISKNWIDTSLLSEYISTKRYSDSTETYQAIINFVIEYLSADTDFDKLLYEYLIKSGRITGTQICAVTYEQGVLPMDEAIYQGLLNKTVDSYAWLTQKINNLEITPGQLALEPCTGAAVVSDPNTGEVLACVSYPGYDNNRLTNTMDSEYYNQLVTGLSQPFYNRATQEKTAPGSTYKMVSAAAALTENLVKEDDYVFCTGVYEKITPSPKCWVYPSAHGSLSAEGAIQHSCNIYFYDVGYRFGLDEEGNYNSTRGTDMLEKYSRAFGLGEKSGIEIPESEPEISDEYSVQSAIGQGTNNYTVSQLNRYVGAVANKGTVYNLTLLDRTTDSNGKIIKDYEPVVYNKMDNISQATWNIIHGGMEGMVNSDPTFSGMEIQMAGKTGTAQQSNLHPDHALFVGFAPTEQPEVAIAVRIANGYTSTYTSEIARDIVKTYYQVEGSEELVTGHAAQLGTVISGD